nr:putative internal virion protein [uncultured Mediterranean phage uvMED]BAR31647.1 putative internal virion protein [uncultured Mediterranean phage uvMED]
MAQFGFGLNINETAQETGYDQYQTSLFESLGAVAKDNWNFNPVISLLTLKDIQEAKQESRIANIVPRDKKLLNEEYKDLGLYFEQDEYQSVVDIMVEKKKKEKERQSIMMRGPEGSWNPLSGGFYVGAAKLAVGIGTSFLDPINIGASFVPIYGQLRFARSIAKAKSMGVKSSKAFRNTRLKRGVAEGAVGATLIEPLVYGVAQRVQADYDIYDSFLNVAFGTVIGGGLHVGAGKLRDMNTARKFNARILANRENLSKPEGGDPEVDLYAEYYPKEVVDKMMQLDQMDVETRNKLLAKGIGDMMLDEPLNVMDIANADPTLNGTSTKQLDLLINKARKNIEIIKKDTQIIIRDGGKVNKKHLQNATKKYNDLLAERKKLEKTTKTEPVITDPIVNRTKASKQIQVESTKQNVAELSSSQQDSELGRVEARLIKLRTKQNDAGLPLEFTNKSTRKKDETLKEASEELEEVNAKSDDLENGITDYINCTQGN